MADRSNSIMVNTYSSVVIALVAVALVVGTWVAVGFIVEIVMVSMMEADPLVVHPFPSCFEGLALVAILRVVLKAELHQVHFQDSVIRPSSRPCLAWQVPNLANYLVPLLLLLIWVLESRAHRHY